VLDNDTLGECLMFGVYMVFDPEAGGLIQWSEQVKRAVTGADEIRTARRELPEATNESLCEDIIPPGRRCPRKLNLGKAQVGFLPL
jgi:hypothetical protein